MLLSLLLYFITDDILLKYVQGHPKARAKQFPGKGANGKKDQKIVKNTEK